MLHLKPVCVQINTNLTLIVQMLSLHNSCKNALFKASLLSDRQKSNFNCLNVVLLKGYCQDFLVFYCKDI